MRNRGYVVTFTQIICNFIFKYVNASDPLDDLLKNLFKRLPNSKRSA